MAKRFPAFKGIIILVTMALMITYGAISYNREKKNVVENRKETVGVTQYVHTLYKSTVMRYFYVVDGNYYTGTVDFNMQTMKSPGQFFTVYYSAKTPQHHIVNFNKIVPDSVAKKVIKLPVEKITKDIIANPENWPFEY